MTEAAGNEASQSRHAEACRAINHAASPSLEALCAHPWAQKVSPHFLSNRYADYSNRRPAPPAQSGFTLLEVLIASTLMMVMMTLLLGGLRMAAGSWDAGDRQAEQLNRLLVTQNFFRAQLSGLRPFMRSAANAGLGAVNVGAKPYFAGGPDWLEYAAALPPQVHGGLYIFRIFVDRQKNEQRLMVSVHPVSSGNQPESGPHSIEDVILLERLQSLSFSYFEKPERSRGGAPQWLPAWTGSALPLLVKIRIADNVSNWPEMTVAPQVRAKM